MCASEKERQIEIHGDCRLLKVCGKEFQSSVRCSGDHLELTKPVTNFFRERENKRAPQSVSALENTRKTDAREIHIQRARMLARYLSE